MNHEKILIGGIYLVRFAKGVLAKAEILRAVPFDERADPVRPGVVKPEVTYECRLAHSVGQYKKGHIFQARARSVKEEVEPPPGGRRETAKTEKDLQRQPPVPEVPPQGQATPPESAGVASFLNLARNAAFRARSAQQAVDSLASQGYMVRAVVTLTISLAELPAVIASLHRYDPQLTVNQWIADPRQL